jgi:3-dehydroquinate synthase
VTSVEVALGARSYRVHIGAGLLDSSENICESLGLRGRCVIITDSHVEPLYAGRVADALSRWQPLIITVSAGENAKSLDRAEEICDRMILAGLDRSAFIVALGGGVIGDLAGFVAAIYYRGIPFLQMPTTVVALVDSSVGGKTGVNARGGKNLIGAFHQPRAVIADVNTLHTLPAREFNEGFAEVIKHAIIRDAELFASLKNFRRENNSDLSPLIARNVAIKAAIVSADEHETSGERALLNFGHTIGHGIENAAGYGRYLHGEAISLGLVAASEISVRRAGLPPEQRNEILARLVQFNLPTRLPADISTEAIMAALRTDKKFAAGQIRFILTSRVGSAFVSKEITLEEIRVAVEALR